MCPRYATRDWPSRRDRLPSLLAQSLWEEDEEVGEVGSRPELPEPKLCIGVASGREMQRWVCMETHEASLSIANVCLWTDVCCRLAYGRAIHHLGRRGQQRDIVCGSCNVFAEQRHAGREEIHVRFPRESSKAVESSARRFFCAYAASPSIAHAQLAGASV